MLAKSINAIAFTTGKDIFFQTGKYEPNTKSGYELIAHEVTHTVQQANGQVKPGIDQDSSLETAAQSKAAQLAAKFDTNTKITNVKPVPRSRITSPKTALAFQREAASSSAKLDVNKLDAAHKLLEAIKHAPLGESVKQQILGAVSLQSLGIFALVFGLGAFAQFTPVGWAADLIIAGLIAFGAYSVGSIIFDVIKDFGAFAQTAVNAKTEDDLKRAGHHFSDAVAKIGVNVVIALIAHSVSKGVNARVKSSANSRNPTSPAAIQTKLDAIKQNSEALNKPVETSQKPVSSVKPNQDRRKQSTKLNSSKLELQNTITIRKPDRKCN